MGCKGAAGVIGVVGVVMTAACAAVLPRPACPVEMRAPAGTAELDERDRAVFRALSGPRDVIADRTSTIDAPFGIKDGGDPRILALLPALVERNHAPAAISRLRNGSCLITEPQLRAVSSTKDFWRTFRDAFGNRRVMHLSLPAYAADGRTALVYVGWQADFLFGEGNLVLLEQDASARWRVVGERMIWIS